MIVHGSCYCGSIKYQAEVHEDRVGICHCRDCQIFSGSAFRMAAIVELARFEFTAGTPNYFDKTADSGQTRRMAFCGECGTHICAIPGNAEQGFGFVTLRLATAEEFGNFRPSLEAFCSSRVPWLKAIEGTTEFPRMPVLQ